MGILTIPNIISFARLALVPLFLWLVFGPDEIAAAGWLLGIIGGTDWIDGYLARRLGQESEFGELLDPLADRIAVFAAVVAGWIVGVLPWWFSLALIAREAAIGVGALIIALRGGGKLAVRFMGKLATMLLYLAVAWLYIGKGTPLDPLVWAAWTIAVPGLVLYYIVGLRYLRDAGDVLRGLTPAGSASGPSG